MWEQGTLVNIRGTEQNKVSKMHRAFMCGMWLQWQEQLETWGQGECLDRPHGVGRDDPLTVGQLQKVNHTIMGIPEEEN